jgi:uncharacterized protein (TIGR01244 family)
MNAPPSPGTPAVIEQPYPAAKVLTVSARGFDISTPDGRKRAWDDMMWTDHGFLRVHFRNLHQIDADMWRSNQPSPDHIAKAAKLGIRTVINLRGFNDSGQYWLEKEACEAHGITLVDWSIRSRDTPSREVIEGARAMFESLTFPALMHCKSGADRAGLMATLYVIFKQKRPVSEALEQLSLRYLHVRAGKTGLIDHFFETFLNWAKANGRADTPESFLRWVREDFDHAATKAAFMDNRFGSWLTDKVLRRE